MGHRSMQLRSTFRSTLVGMSYPAVMGRSLHVRLDEGAEQALAVLRNCGMNDSEAVRTALVESAAFRTTPESLRAEVERIAQDPQDRAARDEVLRFIEELSEPLPDE